MSPPARSGRWLLLLLLALLCIAPRALRLAQPATSVAGSAGGQVALLLARGYEPYVHAVQPGLPVGEAALALAVRAVGPSLGPSLDIAELCNGVAILLVAAALWVAGRRLAGPLAGSAAALLWSWSAWVTHVNLFARADWAALGTALALAVYLAPAPLWGRRLLLLALSLAFALGVEFAAATTAFALLVHLVVTGRARDALRLLLALACGVALLAVLGRALWGEPFLEQAFVLRLAPAGAVAAEPGTEGAVARLLALTEPAIALGLVALVAVGLPRLARPEGAVALVLVAELMVALARGTALRAEDAIALVPASALLGGALLAELAARRERAAVAGLASALVLAALLTVPERWLPGEPGEEVPGAWFGGRARATIARQADFLARFSRPQDLVATAEPWSAFAADRLEFPRETPRGRVSRGWLVQSLSLREIALVVEPIEALGELYDWDLRLAGMRRFTDDVSGITAWRPAEGWTHPQVRALAPDPERPSDRPRSRPPGPAAARAGGQP